MTASDASPPEPPLHLWEGDRVCLRAIEPEDAEALRTSDDSATQRLDGDVHFPSSAASAREWATTQSRRSEDDRIFLAIERRSDGALAGTISVSRADRRHGRFSFGLGLYRDYRREGIGREAVLLVLRYYFTELRYEKCDIEVYEYNEPSLAFFRSLGFVEEGCRRSAIFTRGTRWDEVLFGLTRSEFTEGHPEYAEFLT